MENNEFEVCIKNRTCYYFDGIIKLEDFDFDNILIDGKSHGNILIYGICVYALRMKFNKIDGYIRTCDGTRYLTFFGTEKYDTIFDRIRYLISLKRDITYIFLLVDS